MGSVLVFVCMVLIRCCRRLHHLEASVPCHLEAIIVIQTAGKNAIDEAFFDWKSGDCRRRRGKQGSCQSLANTSTCTYGNGRLQKLTSGSISHLKPLGKISKPHFSLFRSILGS